MTEPQESAPDLAPPTDTAPVTDGAGPADDTADAETPTSSAARFEAGDTEGGTGGLDAGGAG